MGLRKPRRMAREFSLKRRDLRVRCVGCREGACRKWVPQVPWTALRLSVWKTYPSSANLCLPMGQQAAAEVESLPFRE